LVLLVPPGHDISAEIEASALLDLPLILPGPAHGLRQLLEGWARARGIRLAVNIELDSYQNIKELVERGKGVSILPLHAVAREAAAGTLKVVRWHAADCLREVYLVGPLAEASSHACAAVMSLLRELMRNQVQGERWTGTRWLGASVFESTV